MNFFLFFSDFLFPVRCPICDKVLKKGDFACQSCWDLVPSLANSPCCNKCGRPLLSLKETYCSTCCKHELSFDRGFSLWNYNHPAIKRSLKFYKYRGRCDYSIFYAKKLIETYPFLFSNQSISALIPVPIHKKRRRIRGYNQAELLAKELSKQTGIPLITNLLLRSKNTLPQNKLNFTDRRKNLKNAFSINQNSPFYKKSLTSILLIDDIYTTGSTADICSSLLKESGVMSVYVLCLSSTQN